MGGGLKNDGLDSGERPSAPPVCHNPVLTRESHKRSPRALGWVLEVKRLMDPALGEFSQKVVSVGMPLAANNS